MNTEAPSAAGVSQSSIAGRVFSANVASWLGVTLADVPTGARTYIYMSAPDTNRRSRPKAQRTMRRRRPSTTRELSPKRLTGRYSFSIEDLATFSGMEAALRADLRDSLSDALDEEIVAGDSSGQHLERTNGPDKRKAHESERPDCHRVMVNGNR